MARNDVTSALELRVKVNEQNQSTFSEKKNSSMLRLPTDPSWPKIPSRRLTNSTNDIIDSPCVITLTDKVKYPCKNRSVVRALSCQRAKPDKECEVITQISRRLPTCADPRFRRQILQKTKDSNETYCEVRDAEQKTHLDKCILQKTKTVEENIMSDKKNIDNYTPSYLDRNKLLESVAKSRKESSDRLVKQQASTLEANYSSLRNEANEQGDTEDKSFQEQKQDVKTAYQSNGVVVASKDQEITENVCTSPSQSMPTLKHPANKSCLIDDTHQYDARSNDNISQNKDILRFDKKHCNLKSNKEKINLSVSLNEEIMNRNLIGKNRPDFDGTNNTGDGQNDENVLDLNIPERLRTAIEGGNPNSCIITKNHITDNKIQPDQSIMVASSLRSNISKQVEVLKKNQQLIMKESAISTRNDVADKILQKCIRSSSLSEDKSNDDNEENHRESYIGQNRKMVLSRKAKSFLQKRSRLAIADCTLILPGPCRIKGIRSDLLKHRKFCSLRSLQAEHSVGKLSSISLDSHRLLNKNYWEYYIKPKRKITAKLDTAAKRDKRLNKSRDQLKSRTSQRCSLLACMINTTVLQDPVIVSGKSSSNPAMCVIPALRENISNSSELLPASVKQIKRKKVQQARKGLFALKIIALLSITMYVAVMFLPMIYEHFFEDEYDDYDNENYIELTFRRIASSFQEILDEIIHVLSSIFYD